MALTLNEAVVLTGKSRQTIWRWKKDGIDISDETALLEHSEFMDLRSVGRAAVLALDREPARRPKTPVDASSIVSAVDTLIDAFKRRLAKETNAEERSMIDEEIGYL